MAPFSNKNSARWKPSGKVSRTVCSITRGPAKPIKALGSAKTTSPKNAKLADTPPMVGSVKMEMKGNFLSLSKCKAAAVLVICINEFKPSCMRAPPEAATQINGQFKRTASRTPRTKRSPTTEPIEPPMNLNSNTAITTAKPLILPLITTMASSSPVALRAAVNLSGYFLLSLNFKISTGLTVAPIS